MCLLSETLKLLPKKNLLKYSVHPESASMLSYLVVLQGFFFSNTPIKKIKNLKEKKPYHFRIETFFYL